MSEELQNEILDVEKAKAPLSKEEQESQMSEMAARTFFHADRALRRTNLGRGAVIRALRAALHEDITDTQLKLLSQEEKNLAVMLYEMLTARTLMQAQVIKNNKKGEINEQSNESNSSTSESEVG